MAGVLLSGPAGSAKSEEARRVLSATSGPAIASDFQAIVAALLLLDRGPDGKYPVRPSWVLPLAEYVRRAAITGAQTRDIFTVVTNSDGDPTRRRALLSMLGDGAQERVIDPGLDVVTARLSDAATGELEPECDQAIQRWYGRRGR